VQHDWLQPSQVFVSIFDSNNVHKSTVQHDWLQPSPVAFWVK
jgi:hypothetical protein